VVMVPPTLRDKWPKDWSVFQQKCLRGGGARLRAKSADSGVEFLRLLDDPPELRAHLIFLTHGALHRALTDGYAKLAVIRRAFKGRSSLSEQRLNFPKFAGRLLQMETSVERRAPGLLGQLLDTRYEDWRAAIRRADPDLDPADDPVPLHLREALENIDKNALEPLVEALRELPLRESANIDGRLKQARQALAGSMAEIWKFALKQARFVSPLLILD